MKTKQQTIQETYIKLLGEKMYNENKSVINFNDGTIKLKVGLKLPNNGVGFHFITTFSDYSIVIANDLIGIENNNGWIELKDRFCFPKEKGHYWFFTKNKKECQNYFNPNSKEDGYRQHFLNMYTHYQPIEKPKPPIY